MTLFIVNMLSEKELFWESYSAPCFFLCVFCSWLADTIWKILGCKTGYLIIMAWGMSYAVMGRNDWFPMKCYFVYKVVEYKNMKWIKRLDEVSPPCYCYVCVCGLCVCVGGGGGNLFSVYLQLIYSRYIHV